ncbi:MAG: class C beta-lactamase-related serine hydrolase [Cytophagales bacterium]|nr:MAG: class C beta-lactamase-related serine hydrolase [Cytophagales bacterium]
MKSKTLILSFFVFANYVFAQANWRVKVDFLLSNYQKPNSPALAIDIIQNSKLIYSEEIGLANLEYDIPNPPTHRFGVASVAKQFTAACIWSLIHQNKISLTDDVGKY